MVMSLSGPARSGQRVLQPDTEGHVARSLNTVGTDVCPLTVFDTSVTTSESRTLPNRVGSAPDAASSESMIRFTGERPVRATSPHAGGRSGRHPKRRRGRPANERKDVHVISFVARQPLVIRGVMKISSSRLSSLSVALEQPAEQRHAVQQRHAVVRRLLPAHVDAADDRRLAVGRRAPS